jgi:hypothetical protein
MATNEDVRRIAATLPESVIARDGLTCSVAGKAYAWPWLERVDPKKARVPRRDVLAVRVANDLEKQSLLAVDPEVIFTEPHYDGYPAVLIRLPGIDVRMLEDLLTDAWRTRAPRRLRDQLDS